MKFVTDRESSPLRYNQLCGRPYLRRLGVNKKMKSFFTLCLLVFFSFKFYANDYQLELDNRQYFGTVAKTTVNDDNLNIRLKPSTSNAKRDTGLFDSIESNSSSSFLLNHRKGVKKTLHLKIYNY